MDENIKDQDVLLVKEQGEENVKVVAGTDNDGRLKTVPPSKQHEKDFMKIDKHSNVLENFFSNFMRQAKDPTRFSFFIAPMEKIENSAVIVDEYLKAPDSPQNKEALDSVRVNPEDYAAKQQQATQGYQPMDAERVDWSLLERIGITRESLEKSKALDAMLNFRKSPGLIPITLKVGDDVKIRTEARLSLKELSDGRIVPNVHAIQKEPRLDRSFYGHTFTEQDKKALTETGNLGRAIDLKIPGREEPLRSLVSIDRQTNDLVALDASKVRIPNEIKGVALTEQQKRDLSEGKQIHVDGMTAKNGNSFSATLQFNADKRGLEFQFGNQPRQKQEQQQTEGVQSETDQTLRVPKKLLGRDISPEEAEKLCAGTTVYMTGLLDKEGKPFNAYVKPNFEKNKFDFLKWNPDKSQAKEVTPDNASATQVAVNSQGKTNEATKNVKEPLQQGQTQPTEQQNRESEQRQQQNKPKGMRM